MGCGGSSPVAPEDDVPEIHQATREELIRSPVPDSVQAPIPVSAKPQSTGRGLHLTTAKLPTGKLTPKTTPWEVLHAEQLNTGVPHTEALAKCIKECEDAVDAILASLGDGEKFTDSWAVGPAALYTDGEAPCHDCTVTAPDEWRRLSEMCDAPVLISDSVSAGDVRQGSIGDCFLLSAIAAVASKRRELLVNNFVKYDVAKGVFGVRLFINGVWTFVIVDDFAAYTSDGQLVYASCANSSELWLPVLEKAIAKVCCCYENIDGGVTDWALEMLTGGLTEPGNEIVIADHEPAACWEKIDALLRRGDVLAVSSFSEGEYKDKGIEFGGGEGTAGEGVLACGLVAGHAYGLTACIEFEGTKLFKIRNPWGEGEWNGAWGDKSEEIQRPGAKEALGHTDEDDGVFFMDADAFSRYWESVSSVRLFDSSYHLARASGHFLRGLKIARATESYSAEDEDELSFEEGDEIVLTDMQNLGWWKGHLATDDHETAEHLNLPSDMVELVQVDEGGSNRLHSFELSAEETTEAVIALSQPDWHAKPRSFKMSEEHGMHVKNDVYSEINLCALKGDAPTGTDAGDAEILATQSGTVRQVVVTVEVGPDPVVLTLADYGGEGEPFLLRGYAKTPLKFVKRS